jgi:raffinose/stachyose/melibiose transport system substrate-binding protein
MSADKQPDVFFNWNGDASGRFVRDGKVMDIGELGNGRWNGVVAANLLQSYTIDGKLYGVPISRHTAYFFYNKAFFDTHKLAPAKTTAELRALCKEIRRLDPKAIPIVLGAKEPWTINHYVSMLFARTVPAAVRETDYALKNAADALFADPGYQQALEELVAMKTDGCFNDGVNSVSPEEARSIFASELAVMTYCGTFCVGPLVKEGFSGKYTAFRMPAVAGAKGDPDATFYVLTGLQIAANTKNKEAAADLINHYVGPDMQAEMVKQLGRLPVNPAAMAKVGEIDPMIRWSIDDLNSAGAPISPLDVELEANVSKVLLTGGQEIMNGTKTPAQLMSDVRASARDAKIRLGR